VNSRHHQSVEKPGRGLLVTATAPDGVIEAVEWTGGKTATEQGKNWIVGVQWHPETMRGDALAAALFKALVRASTAVFPQAT
jgi:putative glutamine amidotransferase